MDDRGAAFVLVVAIGMIFIMGILVYSFNEAITPMQTEVRTLVVENSFVDKAEGTNSVIWTNLVIVGLMILFPWIFLQAQRRA